MQRVPACVRPAQRTRWWWQYGLLMQIPEGIAWLQLDGGQTDIRAVSRVAFVLNITQPLALLAAVRASARGLHDPHSPPCA